MKYLIPKGTTLILDRIDDVDIMEDVETTHDFIFDDSERLPSILPQVYILRISNIKIIVHEKKLIRL